MWLSFAHPNDHPKLLSQNLKPDMSHTLSDQKQKTKQKNNNKLCQLRLDLV